MKEKLLFIFTIIFITSCSSADFHDMPPKGEKSHENQERFQREAQFKEYHQKKYGSLQAGSQMDEKCSNLVGINDSEFYKVCAGERSFQTDLTVKLYCKDNQKLLTDKIFNYKIGNKIGQVKSDLNGVINFSLRLNDNDLKHQVLLANRTHNFKFNPKKGPFEFFFQGKDCLIVSK